jgi:cytochrome c oxidase subunit 2
MRSKFDLRNFLLLLAVSLLNGCGGNRSALNPAGEDAEKIAALFWWMTAAGILVWTAVMALAVYVVRASNDTDRERQAKWLIVAGAVVPAVVLAVLLVVGLRHLPEIIAPAPEGSLRIAVKGEQWWWRFRYERPNGLPFEVANEIRIPVGKPVEFHLESDNVIHSFWIPSLGGKIDLIPGRVNRLVLRPTKTGTFRGMCAEFCGTAHAKMSFAAIVVSQADFDQWLIEQSREAKR